MLLAGGSAFGLDAATGVVRYLEEHGIGFEVGDHCVPIVPAAILFDLGLGTSRRPDAMAGYRAAARAHVRARGRGLRRGGHRRHGGEAGRTGATAEGGPRHRQRGRSTPA